MLTRRALCKPVSESSALLALSPTVPAFLARTAARPTRAGRPGAGGRPARRRQRRHQHPGSSRRRGLRALPQGPAPRQAAVDPVNDQVGLHPGLRELSTLLERGQLALVSGVSYPNPNRSHFESMAIWQTARLDPEQNAGPGWIGRALDARAESAEGATRGLRRSSSATARPPWLSAGADVRLGTGPCRRSSAARGDLPRSPRPIWPVDRGRRQPRRLRPPEPARRLCVGRARQRADARSKGSASESYPDDPFGERLRTIAQLLKAGLGARVFYTVQPGYDTHAGQLETHDRLLGSLSSGPQGLLRGPGRLEAGRPRTGPLLQRVRPAGCREQLGGNRPWHRGAGLAGGAGGSWRNTRPGPQPDRPPGWRSAVVRRLSQCVRDGSREMAKHAVGAGTTREVRIDATLLGELTLHRSSIQVAAIPGVAMGNDLHRGYASWVAARTSSIVTALCSSTALRTRSPVRVAFLAS